MRFTSVIALAILACTQSVVAEPHLPTEGDGPVSSGHGPVIPAKSHNGTHTKHKSHPTTTGVHFALTTGGFKPKDGSTHCKKDHEDCITKTNCKKRDRGCRWKEIKDQNEDAKDPKDDDDQDKDQKDDKKDDKKAPTPETTQAPKPPVKRGEKSDDDPEGNEEQNDKNSKRPKQQIADPDENHRAPYSDHSTDGKGEPHTHGHNRNNTRGPKTDAVDKKFADTPKPDLTGSTPPPTQKRDNCDEKEEFTGFWSKLKAGVFNLTPKEGCQQTPKSGTDPKQKRSFLAGSKEMRARRALTANRNAEVPVDSDSERTYGLGMGHRPVDDDGRDQKMHSHPVEKA